MTVLRAICFDLDDTLIDRAAAFERAAASLVARFPRMDRARLAELDGRGHADRLAMATALVAEYALPLSPTALRDELIALVVAHTTAVPGAAALLRDLSARAKIAIVTNGGGRTQREKLAFAALDGLAGAVFVSAEVGAAKPDGEIFARALAWAGCAPHEALHVGDDPLRDVEGASRAGLRTAWLAHGRDYPAAFARPTHVIDRLDDLRDVLAERAA